MFKGIRSLDRVLRGEVTRPIDIRRGMIDVPLGGLAVVIFLLAMVYGVCMGVYALVGRWGTPRVHDGLMQIASSAIKVPALLVLTLLVTCPSLYVFNALLGSRLRFGVLLRLLTAAVGVLVAVLASFGTILVFFSVCTESYAFIILLNVVLFAIAGGLGLGFLLQTLHRLAAFAAVPMVDTVVDTEGDAPETASPTPGPLDRLSELREVESVRRVFRIWVLVFGLVGGQMSWVLRPFVLAPNSNFVIFRKRESNFFQAVFGKCADLFSDSTAKKNSWGR